MGKGASGVKPTPGRRRSLFPIGLKKLLPFFFHEEKPAVLVSKIHLQNFKNIKKI